MAEQRPEPQREINWEEVHQRLTSAQLALEQGWAPSPVEKAKILKERAMALAVEVGEGEVMAEERLDLLEFVISGETYGLESSYVREVYPLKEFTPLPCTPSFLLGIINVRGEIIPVNDIRGIFGLPQKGLAELNKVIILKDKTMELGVLADAVVGVRSVPVDEIQPPPPTLTGIRAEFLRGVTKGYLVVLDAGRFLTDKAIIVQEEV